MAKKQTKQTEQEIRAEAEVLIHKYHNKMLDKYGKQTFIRAARLADIKDVKGMVQQFKAREAAYQRGVNRGTITVDDGSGGGDRKITMDDITNGD
jgi:hypothetical protein